MLFKMTITAPQWPQGKSGQSVVVDTQHHIRDTWDKSVPSLTSASGVWRCLGVHAVVLLERQQERVFSPTVSSAAPGQGGRWVSWQPSPPKPTCLGTPLSWPLPETSPDCSHPFDRECFIVKLWSFLGSVFLKGNIGKKKPDQGFPSPRIWVLRAALQQPSGGPRPADGPPGLAPG